MAMFIVIQYVRCRGHLLQVIYVTRVRLNYVHFDT
jgi:hypothetical protein